MAECKLDIEVGTKLELGTGNNSSDSVGSEFESCDAECCPVGDPELGNTLDSLDMEGDRCSDISDLEPELVDIE